MVKTFLIGHQQDTSGFVKWLNDKLVELQNKGCTIIDIKYSAIQDVTQFGSPIFKSALIIYKEP